MSYDEYWTENDVEGSGRDLILWYYPRISLKILRRTTKKSVGIAGLQADIWTWDLPNTKQECRPWRSVLSPYHSTLCSHSSRNWVAKLTTNKYILEFSIKMCF
jgi:hypothetical protein